jgi:hypothetical protein
MNHNGVEYILVQAEPGSWKWQFIIGKEVSPAGFKLD